MTSAPPPPSTSSHRLQSVSASQTLTSSQSTNIPTGSKTLDKHLSNGLSPSKVHELCGPPGAGKTAMAMQLATNTLISGYRVVWIDTSYPFPISRLLSMLSAHSHPEEDPLGYLSSLQVLQAGTLAHFLALFLHPLPSFPQEKTGLVVVDNMATLFASAFPPGSEDFSKKPPAGERSSASPGTKATSRKVAIMANIVKALERLAMTRKLAVLVLNQMTTRVIPGSDPVLQPAVISPIWSSTLCTRLYIHRNHISHSKLADPDSSPAQEIRFVSVLKANGVSHHDFENKVVGKVVVVIVKIHEGGISDVELIGSLRPTPPAAKDKRLSLPPSPDASPSASPLAARSKLPKVLVGPLSSTKCKRHREQSPSTSPLPPHPKTLPAISRPKSPKRSESPVRKKRKTGLEAGVVRGSDEEDSEDESLGDGLDNGLGAELPAPAKEVADEGVTTLGGVVDVV